MKQVLTFAFLFFALSLTYAQSFTISELNGHTPYKSGQMSIEFPITNNTSDTLFVTWVKSDSIMPKDWTSNVCDLVNCYGPGVLTKTFPFKPNATGNFFVDVTSTSPQDKAIVHVVYSISSGESYRGTYTFGGPVGNENVLQASLKIYPNPVTESFTIENGQNVANVEIINILGSKVLTSTDKQVDVSQLHAGLYFVRLSDTKGRILATRKLQKN